MGVYFARAATAAGHKVVATGRNLETVRSAVGNHEQLLVAELDITDAQGAERAVAAALAWFGRIDVLVNNAGNSSAASSRRAWPARSSPTGSAR
jgi:NADP-dependent 3-hydroxy acid dehydrogenase YdfG